MYYLAFVVGLMPGIILLLPVALLTSGSQRRLGGRTLFSMAPVSRASERLACTAVASVLSLACLAAALLPAALLAAIRNGIGDFAYPVVSIADGVVSSSTIGDVLAQDAALMTFASLMMVALVAMAESIRARCGLGVAFALLVCPPDSHLHVSVDKMESGCAASSQLIHLVRERRRTASLCKRT